MAYIYKKGSKKLKDIRDSIAVYIDKNDGCTVKEIMKEAYNDPIPASIVNTRLDELKEDGTIELIPE